MRLSPETLVILKNFSGLNQSLFFTKGNILRTLSTHKAILAQASIKEDIPIDFGIYDLSTFLSVLSFHKESPEFEFSEHNLFIIGNNGRSKMSYRFCSKEHIITPPDKKIKFEDPEIEFDFSLSDFTWIEKASHLLSSPNIAVESDGDKIYITTYNIKDSSAHTERLEIGEGNGVRYNMIFKTDNFNKLLPGNYNVKISSSMISLITNKDIDLHYYIATEKESVYEG